MKVERDGWSCTLTAETPPVGKPYTSVWITAPDGRRLHAHGKPGTMSEEAAIKQIELAKVMMGLKGV